MMVLSDIKAITKEKVEEYTERCKNDIVKPRVYDRSESLSFGLIRAIIDYGALYESINVYYDGKWEVSSVYAFKTASKLYLVVLDLGVVFSAKGDKAVMYLNKLHSELELIIYDDKAIGHRHDNKSGYSYAFSYYTRIGIALDKSKTVYFKAHQLIFILGRATKEDMRLYANTYYDGGVDVVINHINMSNTMDYFKDMHLNRRDNLELVVRQLNNAYAEDGYPINSKVIDEDVLFKYMHLEEEYKNGSAYIGSNGCLYLNGRVLLRYDMLPSVVNC